MTTLDAAIISDSLTRRSASRLERLEVFKTIDSTNNYLMIQAAPAPGRCCAVIAEHQTAGRGRNQNHWISAPGSSLCLSIAYTFERLPEMLPPLTLALGVGVADALQEIGVADVRLKWPNDILISDAKLGGILTETRYHGNKDISVVVGLGINLDLPDVLAHATEFSWADHAIDLESAMVEPPPRDRLAANMIDACVGAFQGFEKDGFPAFENQYQSYDWLRGKSVVVATADGDLAGTATGVDGIGALLIDGEHGQTQVISGSVKHVESRAEADRTA